ncbi:MAG TPA: hypothetical protein VFZ17_11615 [Acidimicrobiia bacterium]|nr:hypothetical protein [Acidimicrobiia bacterium]
MSADGSWKVTMSTPMGAQEMTLDLQQDGAALTGTMSAAMAPDKMELSDGTVEGDDLAWKAALTQPMPMTLEFAATLDGDSMTGKVKLGTFGDATFEGTRA